MMPSHGAGEFLRVAIGVNVANDTQRPESFEQQEGDHDPDISTGNRGREEDQTNSRLPGLTTIP